MQSLASTGGVGEPEQSPLLAKIRAAQQKYLDDNIEGSDDSEDSDTVIEDEDIMTDDIDGLSGSDCDSIMSRMRRDRLVDLSI
jgi:hypothetical protein